MLINVTKNLAIKLVAAATKTDKVQIRNNLLFEKLFPEDGEFALRSDNIGEIGIPACCCWSFIILSI
ncbi:hypothetical protein GCM10027049_18250 [Mucilaginibacter puniceus]